MENKNYLVQEVAHSYGECVSAQFTTEEIPLLESI